MSIGQSIGRSIGRSITPSLDGDLKAVFPGDSGDSITTPDSTANRFTADIDFRAKIAPTDWTPAAAGMIIAKYAGGGSRAYRKFLATSGKIVLQIIDSLNATTTFTSTVATGFTDGTTHHIRGAFDIDNGAAGSTVNFFTSDDGVTWTPLGDPVVTSAVLDIANPSVVLAIGANSLNTEGLVGAIFSAEILNGIDGTLATDFDANDYVHGDTVTSQETGEIYTLNGNVTIQRA